MPGVRPQTMLLVLFFLSQTFSFAVTMLPSLLIDHTGLSAVQAGVILGLSSLLSGVWQPFVGRLLDRRQLLGTFLVIGLGYTLGVICFIREGQSIGMLFTGALSLCIAMTTLRTLVSMAVIGCTPVDERAKMAGVRYLVANAALGVSAILAFAWLNTHRQNLLLVDLATTWLLGAGAIWFLRRRKVALVATSKRSQGDSALLLATLKRYCWQISGISVISVTLMAHMNYLPLLFAKNNLDSTKMNALMLMLNTTIVVLLVRPMTAWTKHWSQTTRGFISASLIGIGLALAAIFPSYLGIGLSTLIWTVGETIYIPWQQAKLYNYIPHNRPGLSAGALSLHSSVCQVFGSVFGTVLLALPNGWGGAALLALPAVGFAALWFGETKEAGRRPSHADGVSLAV